VEKILGDVTHVKRQEEIVNAINEEYKKNKLMMFSILNYIISKIIGCLIVKKI